MDATRFFEIDRCLTLAYQALADLQHLRVQRPDATGLVDYAKREAAIDSAIDELTDQHAKAALEIMDQDGEEW